MNQALVNNNPLIRNLSMANTGFCKGGHLTFATEVAEGGRALVYPPTNTKTHLLVWLTIDAKTQWTNQIAPKQLHMSL